ncbi:hypothetical protein PFFVO_04803 [Plasmodium falciparum Vietnam Oak-Knoll (FVO)]|uniref:Ubiquitin fusion degradation protein UFD1 n=1 Tax=Plasmodium falciparum Vietnam Oak-Knoll (FVO) TaxID=1036723 RepID=A0A024V1B9_PLAFA|nr:hypothetical protein PFFVO_04803 [Plasmodium falciparum Vietnam Oak-Knoll (FVO)]
MWGFSNFNNLWPRDFLNVSEPFQEEYTCYPVSFIGKDDMENGNKIILPQTALNALARRHISWPMLFEVSNPYTDKRTHSGVLEFISDEGTCHMPYWMMQQLNLKEGDIVRVTSVSLPKGTFVKLKPCSKDFMELSNHRAVLETALRNYATLTIGDNIVIHYLGKTYEIKIVDKRTHSGVLEFISDEGTCHMPYWMMQQLNLKEGDIVRVTSVSLPKGTFVKLKPCSKDFMELSNHRAVLETALRNYATLTIGDNIVIHYLGKTYEIKIVTKCTEYEDLLKKGRIPGIVGKFTERKN